MTVREVANELNLSMSTVNRMVADGKIAAEKIPQSNAPAGFRFNITEDLDSIRRKAENKKPYRPRAKAWRFVSPDFKLPANRDLFTVADLSKLTGIHMSSLHKMIQADNIPVMKNGRMAYLSAANAEKMVEEFRRRHPQKVHKQAQRQTLSPLSPPSADVVSFSKRLSNIEDSIAGLNEKIDRLLNEWFHQG